MLEFLLDFVRKSYCLQIGCLVVITYMLNIVVLTLSLWIDLKSLLNWHIWLYWLCTEKQIKQSCYRHTLKWRHCSVFECYGAEPWLTLKHHLICMNKEHLYVLPVLYVPVPASQDWPVSPGSVHSGMSHTLPPPLINHHQH